MSMLLLLSDDAPNPRSLFAAGEQGFWYDPSDFSTMFQDAAGTTPVTALGQSVGLMLDKRLGLVLGSERLQDFTTGMGGTATAATYNTSTGVGSVTRVNLANQSFVRLTGLAATSGYRMTITNTGAVNIVVRQLDYAGSAFATISVGATTSLHFTGSANCVITAEGGTATFVLNSFRELPGNHATQSTALSRPTLQSGYFSLDKTDDHFTAAAGGAGTTGFLFACGVVVPAAGTARTIFSDRGTNTGYKLGIDATNKVVFSGGTGAAHTTLTSAGALTAGTKYILIAWHDGINLNLSINNVAETPVAQGAVSAGTSSITIGKDNGSASGYWGDRIYTAVYRRNDSSSAAQRSGLYSYIVGKMGGL